MYRYFVSFAFQGPRGIGTGNTELRRSEPIRSMDDITAITDLLRDNGAVNPTVLSFCRFDNDTAVADRRKAIR